jgi:hypothetical protein
LYHLLLFYHLCVSIFNFECEGGESTDPAGQFEF